jgi:hypothetical protein
VNHFFFSSNLVLKKLDLVFVEEEPTVYIHLGNYETWNDKAKIFAVLRILTQQKFFILSVS